MHAFCSHPNRRRIAELLADVAATALELASSRLEWTKAPGDVVGLPILRAQAALDGITLALANEATAQDASGLPGDARSRIAMVLAREAGGTLTELMEAWDQQANDVAPRGTALSLARASTAVDGIRLAFFVPTPDQAGEVHA